MIVYAVGGTRTVDAIWRKSPNVQKRLKCTLDVVGGQQPMKICILIKPWVHDRHSRPGLPKDNKFIQLPRESRNTRIQQSGMIKYLSDSIYQPCSHNGRREQNYERKSKVSSSQVTIDWKLPIHGKDDCDADRELLEVAYQTLLRDYLGGWR